MPNSQPLRVLHIVGILQRGGIETWLMHVLRHLDQTQIQIDFLVQTEIPGAYDAEVEALGCRIWKCPINRRQPWHYARQFQQILREHGPYQIVHSHVHFFSGFTLRLAQKMQVPVRIAHSHNDTSPLSGQAGWARRMYVNLAQFWIRRFATLGLAASREAARDLFGLNWHHDARWQLLYYGVDLAPFQPLEVAEEPAAVRAELGIPADAFVIGHVGRFEQQKNHTFLLKIAEAVYARDPKAYLLLIGDGPLRAAIEQQVAQSPLKARICFAGLRSDVPRLMLSSMDVFVLPSFHEGLPLVGIEAQAAGLPMIVSDTITPELDTIPELVDRLSLDQPASDWAKAILRARTHKSLPSVILGFETLQSSPFNITHSVRQLESVYWQAIQAQDPYHPASAASPLKFAK